MAWIPISGTLPQYSTASNALAQDYYLKFYASGTTTPIDMATDSTGGTLLAQCALSDDGYPITNPLDDTTKFIPHIDQNYRIVLFKSKADADANNTANAAFNIDGMVPTIAPSADAADIVLRDTTVQAQDDYDRSPLFVNGTDFTAGAGPHVITVPSGWVPTNADMRFYRVDNSGIVTSLTPTAKTSTTFTLAETLLSTDTIFIGDDTFRNQMDGDPADIRARIDVYTTSQVDTADNLRLAKSSNLSDLANAATARTNLDVYSKSEAQASPSAVSGYEASNSHYIRSSAGSAFDLDSALAVNTTSTIGPTGSGASITWTDLDALPSGATYADIHIRATIQGASDAIQIVVEMNSIQVIRTEAGSTASTALTGSGLARVRLDGNNTFSVKYFGFAATPTYTVDLLLTGFGV